MFYTQDLTALSQGGQSLVDYKSKILGLIYEMTESESRTEV